MPPIRSKTWCFTAFDLDLDYETQLEPLSPKYCVYQHEICPDTGNEHIQGYIQFTSNKSLRTLKKARPTDHWEIRRGTHEEARNYCMKAASRKPDTVPVEHGTYTKQGQRVDLETLAEKIRDEHLTVRQVALLAPAKYLQYHRGIRDLVNICAEPYTHPTTRGIWLYGPSGIGKSYLVRETFPDLYIKSQDEWWQEYDSEEAVLLDDFDHKGKHLTHELKIWSDRYAFRANVKNSSVQTRYKYFIITSNYTIRELFPPNEDRALYDAISRRFKQHNWDNPHFRPLIHPDSESDQKTD